MEQRSPEPVGLPIDVAAGPLNAKGSMGGLVAAAGRMIARRQAPMGAVVLAYHDIGDDGSSPYQVSAPDLRRQLRYALSIGVGFVALRELASAARAGSSVDGLGAVCFDDALAGVHRDAAPVLADLGVPATIFVPTGLLGRSPPWWPEGARVMTASELVELTSTGVELGSHTVTHPSLPSLDRAQLAAELAGSRHALEDLTRTEVSLLAYPSGHHDHRVRQATANAGYRAGFTFLNGRITGALDPFGLPRLTMGRHHGRVRWAYHLARSAGSWPDTQLEAVVGSSDRAP